MALTVSEIPVVTISGTVTVPAGNEAQLAGGGTVTAAGGYSSPETYSAQFEADGQFTIAVPQDTANLLVAIDGFFKTVPVTPATQTNYTVALTNADYAFEVAYGGSGIAWQKNADGSVTVPRSSKDTMTSLVFAGVQAGDFLLTATLKDIYDGFTVGCFDVGFSIWLGQNMLAYELRESGAVARLYDPDWNWLNGTANRIPGISDWSGTSIKPNNNLFAGLTIEMTMARVGTTIYLWADGAFLGSTDDASQFLTAEQEVAFGLYTRGGTGATFSDISFTTDAEAVAAYIAEHAAQ